MTVLIELAELVQCPNTSKLRHRWLSSLKRPMRILRTIAEWITDLIGGSVFVAAE
jgi:hypothetical protein